LTKVPPAPEPDGPDLRAQLEAGNVPTFKTDIPRLKSFDKAAHAGVPVYGIKDGPSGKRAWAAYEEAGREIEEILGLRAEGVRRHG
jgi:chromosome partitioning protein